MNAHTLACSTVLHHEMEIFRALDLIAADGFKYVEIVDVPGFCPHLHFEGDRSHFVKKLKETLFRNNQAITSLYLTPGSFLKEEISQTFSNMEAGFQLALELDVRCVTVIPGSKVEEEEWEATARSIARGLCRVADLAGEKSIQLQIESPHLNTFTETVGQTLRLFEILDDKRIRCTFDTSHVFRGEKVIPLAGVEQLGLERIGNIHLRDVCGEDISITPGKGHVDFKSFIEMLREKGYDGGISLELEFSNYSLAEKRAELRFAKEYIEACLEGREITSKLKFHARPWVQTFERLVHNPKRELRKITLLRNMYHRLWGLMTPFRPVRAYEGVWKDKYQPFKRSKPVIQRPGSVNLSVPIPRPIRVGILGCGYAGGMHAAGFQRLIGVQVAGVADIDAEKAQSLARRHGCAAFTSLDEMTSRLDLDLVSVCTREWLHHQPVTDLLCRDVDVFSEKVLSSNYDEAQQMVALARKRSRVLGVNYNYRFMPGVQKLKEIIENCYFGKLELLDIKVHAFSYHHALDLVSFLGGEIISVSASYQNDDAMRPFGGMDWRKFDHDILYVPSRNMAATFELRNKAVCTVTSSYFFDPFGLILSVDTLFEKGAVTLTGIRMEDVVGNLSWTSKRDKFGLDLEHRNGVFSKGYEYCFYKSIEGFMNAYVKGTAPETPGEQGLFNILVEKAIHRSYINGQKVNMGQFADELMSSQELPLPV